MVAEIGPVVFDPNGQRRTVKLAEAIQIAEERYGFTGHNAGFPWSLEEIRVIEMCGTPRGAIRAYSSRWPGVRTDYAIRAAWHRHRVRDLDGVVNDFAARHAAGETPRDIARSTGWGTHAVRKYLNIAGVAKLPPKRATKLWLRWGDEEIALVKACRSVAEAIDLHRRTYPGYRTPRAIEGAFYKHVTCAGRSR